MARDPNPHRFPSPYQPKRTPGIESVPVRGRKADASPYDASGRAQALMRPPIRRGAESEGRSRK